MHWIFNNWHAEIFGNDHEVAQWFMSQSQCDKDREGYANSIGVTKILLTLQYIKMSTKVPPNGQLWNFV